MPRSGRPSADAVGPRVRWSGSRTPSLTRPRECVLGGVCAGLAEHLGWPVYVVRWIMVGLCFAGGAGALLYGWLWAFTPLTPATDPSGTIQRVHRAVPVAWLLFAAGAGVAVIAATVVLGSSGGRSSALLIATPLMVALCVAAVAWEQLVDSRELPPGERSSTTLARPTPSLRVASGVLLVAMGLLLVATSSGADAGWAWILVIVTTFAGAAVLLAPWGLNLWRELMAERTARVRDEERAEIAAHLHDSVLQTLALIQNRAGASSEVARIARAQERELRAWLYAGDDPAVRDLATAIQDYAAALELDFGVRFDVVAVGEQVELAGESQPTRALFSAVREAMYNAARHAGGDVSVYVEKTDDALDVFIRDRGPGFDPAEVPEDRLGVRESILGRMRRAGGSARVRPGAGGAGTEIQLHIDTAGGNGA